MTEKWTARGGWVTDVGSSKSFVGEVRSGYESHLLCFTEKRGVSSKEHGWGIAKPKKCFIPESEPKANANRARPACFHLDVHLPCCRLLRLKQAPCLRSPPPPAARSASSRPAFQERSARSSLHPLPGRLPHATLPAHPTQLSAGSGTSRFTQSFPLLAA